MKKKLILVVGLLGFITTIVGQSITGFTNEWNNTYSTSNGIFARAIIDNGSLLVSGSTWSSWPSGTRDQMITKISATGNMIFQTVRAPGTDHDVFQSVCILDNGNYAFFGQQNADGTQYFDAFFTVFNTNGVEVSHNFFSIPGSSSGDDMKKLPNGNLVFTGNHGGGLNFVALTDQSFNQINYQTFPVGLWNGAQLAVDSANSLIYAIGSYSGSTVIQIKKYDYSLNLLGSFTITNTEAMGNYDAVILNNNLLLCGYKEIEGARYGSISKLDSNGNIVDSYISSTVSEFTAITTFGNEVVVSKSNLSTSNYSISNELQVYLGNGMIGNTFILNNGAPFVVSDLVLDQNSLYITGAQITGESVGIPAVQKVSIQAENTCSTLVINTGVLGFNPVTYNNTVTIYPNPANDHITIDCGNLANVSGWTIKIVNTLSQEVFTGAMNTQQYVVPLNTWNGQGVYFVKIYDASNNLVNTKKIILQ
ncbi:Secretion system C-terminal sorting domain [Flavobacteriaceae bacterium]